MYYLLFIILLFLFLFYLHIYYLQKEAFIWVDYERTWAEQKQDIITKLLPPLYKLVNKKYDVSNSDLMNMLKVRWCSRHRTSNIKKQGKDRIKQDKRRAKKNSRCKM